MCLYGEHFLVCLYGGTEEVQETRYDIPGIFFCVKKMRGMLYALYILGNLCIANCWVSLIQRNTCYKDRSWYIFLGFSEEKSKKEDM